MNCRGGKSLFFIGVAGLSLGEIGMEATVVATRKLNTFIFIKRL